MVSRFNHEKTTLPIQDILGVNFYVRGNSFQFRANVCGKVLESIFQGQILFFLWQFSGREILNICFRGKFRFGGFFQFGQICIFKYMKVFFQ